LQSLARKVLITKPKQLKNTLLNIPAALVFMWYLTQIAEAGALRPVLDEQLFSLKDVSQAQDRLSSGQGMGKVVIDVIRNSND